MSALMGEYTLPSGSFDQQGGKSLGHGQQTPEVNFKQLAALVEISIQQGHLVALTGIVDEVVEDAAGTGAHLVGGGADRGRVGHVELDDLEPGQRAQMLDLAQVPGRGKHPEAAAMEFFGQGVADAAFAAARDEHGALLFLDIIGHGYNLYTRV